MGKNKDKKKKSGAVKTAAKTEKKLESKRKKELATIGEEDIESIIASIEQEEAKRQAVIETVVEPPSPRVSGVLLSHPINSTELILFGGEHHDGKKTFVYNALFIYNITKSEWRIIKAPGAPPPRSAHQAVALPSNKGELWIFGGEFTSVTEMQFYHYKDLWLFNMSDKKWQKIESPGGPSSRSGHRMINIRRLLVIFGGYHDNGRNYKYYNDLYIFCTDNRIWKKIETGGIPPAPRSGCLLMPVSPNSIVLYGGYSRIKDGKIDKGITHGDLFRLTGITSLLSEDNTIKSENISMKWESLKGGSHRPTPPRSSFSSCLAPGNRCYVFGGVSDVEETEEQLNGDLYNSLHCLDLESGVWRQTTIRSQEVKPQQEKEIVTSEMEIEDEIVNPITVCSDGVFTMTVGGANTTQSVSTSENSKQNQKSSNEPSQRMNSMIAVQKSILYLYGGLVEKGEKQFTLSDMYSLDLHKFDGWKIIIPQASLPEWLGSDSESESGSESEDTVSDESESS